MARVLKKGQQQQPVFTISGPVTHSSPTEEANVPLWCADGKIRYVSEQDFRKIVAEGRLTNPDGSPII